MDIIIAWVEDDFEVDEDTIVGTGGNQRFALRDIKVVKRMMWLENGTAKDLKAAKAHVKTRLLGDHPSAKVLTCGWDNVKSVMLA